MNSILLILFFLAIGVITGIFSGMFGVGGGLIFVPSLYFALDSLQSLHAQNIPIVVIATSLFAGSLASFSAFLYHRNKQNVNILYALLLGAGSSITAATIPFAAVNIASSELKIIFSVLLIAAALSMLFEKEESTKKSVELNKYYLIPFGLFVGGISALSGLGGGVVFVPLLLYLFNLNIKRAIGTSALAVAITMMVSTITYMLINLDVEFGYLNLGYVDIAAGLPLGIGAVFGAKIGAKIVLSSSNSIIKKIFSLFLIIVIIKILIG